MEGITRATSGSSTAASVNLPSACSRPCHSPVSRSDSQTSPSALKSSRKKSWLGRSPRTCTRCQRPSLACRNRPSRVLAHSRPCGSRSISPTKAAGSAVSRSALSGLPRCTRYSPRGVVIHKVPAVSNISLLIGRSSCSTSVVLPLRGSRRATAPDERATQAAPSSGDSAMEMDCSRGWPFSSVHGCMRPLRGSSTLEPASPPTSSSPPGSRWLTQVGASARPWLSSQCSMVP